jgi:hypothetical protein
MFNACGDRRCRIRTTVDMGWIRHGVSLLATRVACVMSACVRLRVAVQIAFGVRYSVLGACYLCVLRCVVWGYVLDDVCSS